MSERKPMSLGQRWRREATRGIEDQRLDMALQALPHIRQAMLRVRAGGIRAELVGAMGSIHEVAITVRTLPKREWPTLVRVLRRSKSIIEALEEGKVPRSFDRLVARICSEPLFPDSRQVTWACTCGHPDDPCHHVLALHELIARRLEDQPWELLVLRGVDLHDLLANVRLSKPDPDLPPLSFGAAEEPVLYPEGEEGDLDYTLNPEQVAQMLGTVSPRVEEAVVVTVMAYVERADAKDESA